MPKRFHGAVARPEPRRFRVSVPEADTSVLTWIGAQSDLSASVRALIRDAIRRDGYQDATCYPVEQQPRRGRPPRSAQLGSDDLDASQNDVGVVGATGAAEPDVPSETVADVESLVVEPVAVNPEPQLVETVQVPSVPSVATDQPRSVTEMLGAMR